MASLFDLDRLGERLKLYARQEGFKPEAYRLLDETLLRGELPRGEAERATGAENAPAICSPRWSRTASSAPTRRKVPSPCASR